MALNVCKYQSLHISSHENVLHATTHSLHKEYSKQKTLNTKNIPYKDYSVQRNHYTKHTADKALQTTN